MPTAAKPRHHKEGTLAILLIGLFKLIKGILLTLAGIGALHLMNADAADFFHDIARALHLSPANHYLVKVLAVVSPLRSEQLQLLGYASFLYAILFLVEGTGLVMKKKWGEYFSVIITSTFIPFEVFEVVREFTPIRIIFLVLNIAIVIYLILRIRHRTRHSG